MLPLKLVKFFDLQLFKSSLFHSITIEDKKYFFKTIMLYLEMM